MRGRVDASRQARYDKKAGVAEIASHDTRDLATCGRGIPCPHNGDRGPIEQLCSAHDIDQRRRGLDYAQKGRVAGLVDRDKPCAETTSSV
jgi:hypothetical protein